MASSEMEKSSEEKEPKHPSSSSGAPPSSQEPSSTVSAGMTTPDWSGFQAYSPMPPHGFAASSPQPHPYMWGVQHMMMPPYGTPPPHPYVKMYPPGGMYAHPSMPPGSYPKGPYAMPSPNGMAETSGHTSGGTEGDSKRSDVKEKLPIRRSERILNMTRGKNNGTGKNSEASAYSESGESDSDGSSEGSDANSENDSGSEQDWKDDSPEAASESSDSDNGSAGTPLPPVSQTVPVMPKTAAGVPGPPTYTNIRMCAPTNGMHGKASTPPVPRVIPPVSRDGGHSKPFQDEREVKRQKRMQSNRDASERSRLRKQAEFDKLAQDTELLNAENASLRAEMNRLKSKREELASENTSLKGLLLSFPPLEGIKLEKDDQEPDTYQTGFTETKFVSYKDST
ncbi:Basic-leucine zipper domain-containing protein [Hirschfeldia incana]|nr:Basic-leucine zipper domain-containing protein [Hirschfeldia incana]